MTSVWKYIESSHACPQKKKKIIIMSVHFLYKLNSRKVLDEIGNWRLKEIGNVK